MKNIISIDFDIIMAPDIDKYNDIAANINWREMEKLGIKADFTHYRRLTNWLLSVLDKINPENIAFIEDHGQIIKHLPIDEDINLWNIDHHHDCGYSNSADKPLNCGNWVCKIPKLKYYTWINNPTSITDESKSKSILINSSMNLMYYNLFNLPRPDKIILCLSEPWVPYGHRELFMVWKEMLENHYNKKFEIDYTRCK